MVLVYEHKFFQGRRSTCLAKYPDSCLYPQKSRRQRSKIETKCDHKTKTSKQNPQPNSLVIIIHEAITECLPPMVPVGAPLKHVACSALPPRIQNLEMQKQITPEFVLAPIDALQTVEKRAGCFNKHQACTLGSSPSREMSRRAKDREDTWRFMFDHCV